jgi:hypothetical protein
MPTNPKEICRYGEYYYKNEPIIYSGINKMAEYPVTDIYFKNTNSKEEENLLEKIFLNKLGLRQKNIELGTAFYTYGNVFVSVFLPFIRFLKCKGCDFEDQAINIKFKLKDDKFVAECPDCSYSGDFIHKDVPVKKSDGEGINLVVWSPYNIDIECNEITGEKKYYYSIPGRIKRIIKRGKTKDNHIIASLPIEFIKAVKNNHKVVLEKQNLFHMRRPNIYGAADAMNGWGLSIVAPAFKLLYLLSIMRKSEEAIAQERINPWDIFFPQATRAMSNPYEFLNMKKWQSQVKTELDKRTQDKNLKSIMPIPLGYERIGGDAKSLFITPEIQIIQQNIITAMGIPQEFIFGGLQWSGSSVSLRILENHFLLQRRLLTEFNNFVVKVVCRFLKIEARELVMTDFKMADDVARKDLALKLNAAEKISDKTLLTELGWDLEDEVVNMLEEAKIKKKVLKTVQLSQAAVQADVQNFSVKQQFKTQKELNELQMEEQRAQMQQAAAQAPMMPPGAMHPSGPPPQGGPQGGPPQAEQPPVMGPNQAMDYQQAAAAAGGQAVPASPPAAPPAGQPGPAAVQNVGSPSPQGAPANTPPTPAYPQVNQENAPGANIMTGQVPDEEMDKRVAGHISKLMTMPPAAQKEYVANIQNVNVEMAQKIKMKMAELGADANLPQVKPPRSANKGI